MTAIVDKNFLQAKKEFLLSAFNGYTVRTVTISTSDVQDRKSISVSSGTAFSFSRLHSELEVPFFFVLIPDGQDANKSD